MHTYTHVYKYINDWVKIGNDIPDVALMINQEGTMVVTADLKPSFSTISYSLSPTSLFVP